MIQPNYCFQVRLNNALDLPLQYRCDELVNIFVEFGNKELQMVLPQLLESLFGLTDQKGWGLRTLQCNTRPHEFDILFRFLHPLGAMFRLCYRLLGDYVKYEFPLTYLPVSNYILAICQMIRKLNSL
jgi:sphingomyelin phosphodiesterase 4